MLTEDERAYLARATRTMQIIVGALAWGIVSFLVVVLFLVPGAQGPPPDSAFMTYLSVVVALASLIAALIVPGIVLRSHRQGFVAGNSPIAASIQVGANPTLAKRELGPLALSYQTALIIRSAFLEGGAFFCLVAFMIERQTLSLVAAAAMLLFLLAGFPTRSKVEDAIESQRTTIEQLRGMEPIDAR